MTPLKVLRERRDRLEDWGMASVKASWMFRLVIGLCCVYAGVMGSGLVFAAVVVAGAAGLWGIVILRCILIVRLVRLDRTIAKRELDALEG